MTHSILRYDKTVEESMEFVREQRPHVKFTELQIKTLTGKTNTWCSDSLI